MASVFVFEEFFFFSSCMIAVPAIAKYFVMEDNDIKLEIWIKMF